MRLRSLVINVGAIALSAAIVLGLQLPRLNQRISGQTAAETQKALQEEATRLNLIKQLPPKGFGFNNMIANFAFLQFLQYFGDDVARNQFQTGYSLSPHYFENIIARDPRFISAYIYLSSSVSMFAGSPSEAIALYSRGLSSLDPKVQPDSYLIWRYKAIDQLLFLGDDKGARESYLKAADWAEQAIKLGTVSHREDGLKTVAELSRQSAQWLEQDRDLSKARIAAWSFVLQNAVDQKTVAIIAKELDRLGMKIDIKDDRPIIAPK
ncbi:MAG: hypothetical protein NW214_08520 [Pseudanabaenaceae cyanobacterium bins.39]|nr:hypothetical protein [Pseudanabaenaceae cyanobacterium bins.39]